MEYRIEKDSIGEREVPVDAYYGVQSLRGAENFHITGQKLQVNVLAGFPGRDIRSAAFDIAYADGNFSITCYGYGHGCGLSQYGAWGYAANGWTYDQILAHYFPGTSLSAVG